MRGTRETYVIAAPDQGRLAFRLRKRETVGVPAPSVLIVDDDIDLAWITAELLLQEGYDVRVARDGEEGLRLLRENMPDVLILDVEMPLLDGPSVAKRMLVEDCGLEEIPVVLVSGIADLAAVARRVGTPYVLGKPFDVGRLLAMVRSALAERRPPEPHPDVSA